MTEIDWKRKLTSRKFWLSVAAFIGLIILYITGDQSEVIKATELIMAGATVIGYVIGEGLADGGHSNG